MTTEDRAGYIAGLRMLADLLEQHEEVPLPFTGSSPDHSRLHWILLDDADTLRRVVRSLPGTKDKEEWSGRISVMASLAGLHVEAIVHRDAVCTRRVVGTETAEVEEREGEDTRPVITKTVEREIVEWDCSPILKAAAS